MTAKPPSSKPHDHPDQDQCPIRRNVPDSEINLPTHIAGSGSLDRLVDTARDYARQATAENTNTAYARDWKHFATWCRRRGVDPLPPRPDLIGLYIANCAAPDNSGPCPVCQHH